MKNKFNFLTIQLVLISIFSAACTKEPIDDEWLITVLEQTEFDTSYFNIEPVSMTTNNNKPGWDIYHYDTSACKCIFGSDYFVAVRDKNSETKNVVINLQGGGACWPGMTQCNKTADEGSIGSNYGSSMFNNWSTIYLPYCDGSVHVGDNEVTYDGNTYYHHGMKMNALAVGLTKELYPEVDTFLITGCSAGGYGTIPMTMIVRMKYPNAKIFVLNESGPGLLNPNDQETLENIYAAWGYDKVIPKDCELCGQQLIHWYDWLLKNDNKLTIGLYSSYQDFVIGKSFLQMDSDDFKELLLMESSMIHDKYPDNFKRFFKNGNNHCVNDYYYEINGVRYIDWVTSMIHQSDNWTDLLE